MLLQLNIKNFALIEDLSITFDKGFNVFTGETGAGKSILIDAINYVLGSKFNKDLIRTGEDKTYVEAIFTLENDKTKDCLADMDIEYDDMVIISRETFQSGKSINKINGKTVLVTNLKTISGTLIDIHGQHENQNLLDSNNHITYLDSYGGREIEKLLFEYRKYYDEMKDFEKKIYLLDGKDGEREKHIDFLKYQIDEINNAHLKLNEEEELEKKYSILSNSEKIDKVLSYSYKLLYSCEEDNIPIEDSLSNIVKDLRTIEKHMDNIKSIADNIEECYYSLQQSIDDIRNISDTVYYDENELNYINDRIYLIDNLKKKYGASIEEILKYRENIENEYSEYINRAEIIKKLMDNRKKIFCLLSTCATKLYDARCVYAKQLEEAVESELKYIGMEKSSFKISIDINQNYTTNGNNNILFMISTNVGEPLKNLEKIVSGGELSRIMLALKTVFVEKDKIPTIIFDEIDTGISGKIAQSVGEKMYEVSSFHQVFCVTHLPQIACMSDNHYLVEKKVVNEKTYTNVININNEQKVLEIAKMTGGAEVTKLTIEHAEEMIKIVEKNKKIKKQN